MYLNENIFQVIKIHSSCMASVVNFWEEVNLYSQILSGVQALSGFHAYYAFR